MNAARWPWPVARVMSEAPDTTSPAAKSQGTSVWSVRSSTMIDPFALARTWPANAAVSGAMPIAVMITSQSMSNSLPGTGSGRLRPDASGVPGAIRLQRRPRVAPWPSSRTATGAAWKTNPTPSFSVSSASTWWAGISARVRR